MRPWHEVLSRNESTLGNEEIYEQTRVVERLMDEELHRKRME